MAIGDVKGRIGPVVVTEDTHGGGVVVRAGGVQGKGADGVLGDLRKEPAGAGLIETVEHPRDVVIGKRARIDRLTQQQLGVLVLEEALQPVQRIASREGVEHHGQHRQPGTDLHLALDHGVDGLDELYLLGVMLDDGKVADIGDGQRVGVQVDHVIFSSQG